MRRAVAVLACLAALLGSAPSAHAADKPLKVSYNFLVDAILAGYPFNADPPGANIWTCKPTAQHPRPVVLVHGTGGNKNTNWRTYAPLLKNNGYCVYSLTYGTNAGPIIDQLGGFKDIRESAKVLEAFIDKVLASTGAKKVDLIGHSQGTLMPNYYVKFMGGAKHVRNYVSLAALWHGTGATDLSGRLSSVFGFDESMTPVCVACPQMATGSAFMTKMREGGTAKVKGVRYTNIQTEYDELVLPYTSGFEPGERNFTVQDFCPTDLAEHFEIASDPVASQIVLNTLDRTRNRPISCKLVLPFVGPLL